MTREQERTKGRGYDIGDEAELSDDLDVTEELSSSKYPGFSQFVTPHRTQPLKSMTPLGQTGSADPRGKTPDSCRAATAKSLSSADFATPRVHIDGAKASHDGFDHPGKGGPRIEGMDDSSRASTPLPSPAMNFCHDAVQAVQEVLALRDAAPPTFAVAESELGDASSTGRLLKAAANGALVRLSDGVHVLHKPLRLRVRSADKRQCVREAAARSDARLVPARILHIEGRGAGQSWDTFGSEARGKSCTRLEGQVVMERGMCGSIAGVQLMERRSSETEQRVLMCVRGGPWALVSVSMVAHRLARMCCIHFTGIRARSILTHALHGSCICKRTTRAAAAGRAHRHTHALGMRGKGQRGTHLHGHDVAQGRRDGCERSWQRVARGMQSWRRVASCSGSGWHHRSRARCDGGRKVRVPQRRARRAGRAVASECARAQAAARACKTRGGRRGGHRRGCRRCT